MADRKLVRVFISSPSDVRAERLIAKRVIQQLDREFSFYLKVESILWEHEPLLATAHFQDPENIPLPSSANIVVVILWSRLGVLLPHNKFAGAVSERRPVTGTEWEFEEALAASRAHGRPALLVYRKQSPIVSEVTTETATLDHVNDLRKVEQFFEHWFIEEGGGFKAGLSTFASAAAFELELVDHLRTLLRRQIGELGEGAPIPTWFDNPFRGLEVFEREHANIFFGRTRARNELREALAGQAARGTAFVLVLGASGVGKSSLVLAGLQPDLDTPGILGNTVLLRSCIVRPSGHSDGPLTSLADTILSTQALPELKEQFDAAGLGTLLAGTAAAAGSILRQGLSRARAATQMLPHAEARMLVVVDQLEELFTDERISAAQLQGFLAALVNLAGSGQVLVVATLRSDFFDRITELPTLARLAAGPGLYHLMPPDIGEIGQMIRLPAAEAGLQFKPDSEIGKNLDEELQEQASKSRDSLPLLEFALDQLWQRRTENGFLTWQAYREMGGLEGGIGRRAEALLEALPAEVQALFPRVLLQLVTVGQGEAGRTTTRSAALENFSPTGPERTLVDAFSAPDARLLVRAHSQAGPVVRAAHEALLTHWPRAQSEIESARADLQLRARLEVTVGSWIGPDGQSSATRLLGSGKPIEEARDLLARRPEILNKSTQQFIRMSISVREAAEKRSRLIWQLTAVILSVLLLASLTAGAIALQQRERALAETLASEAQRKKALRALLTSTRTSARDLLLSGNSESVADGYRLFQEAAGAEIKLTAIDRFLLAEAARGTTEVANKIDNFGDATLSSDGRHILSTWRGYDYKLLDATRLDLDLSEGLEPPHLTLPERMGDFKGRAAYAIEAGGKRVVMSLGDRIVVWNTNTATTELKSRMLSCDTLSFHPTGRWLTCLAEGTAYVINADAPVHQWHAVRLPTQARRILRIEWLPGREHVVTFGTGGEVTLYDLARQRPVARTILAELAHKPIVAVSFGAEDRVGIAAGRDVVILNNRTLQWIGKIRNPDLIKDFCLNPFDERALTLSEGTLRVWHTRDVSIISTSGLLGFGAERACFLPDGTRILLRSLSYQLRHGISGRLIGSLGAANETNFVGAPKQEAMLPNLEGFTSMRVIHGGNGTWELAHWAMPHRRIAAIRQGRVVRWMGNSTLLVLDKNRLSQISGSGGIASVEILGIDSDSVASSDTAHTIATLKKGNAPALWRRKLDGGYDAVTLQLPAGRAVWDRIDVDADGGNIFAAEEMAFGERRIAVWNAEGHLVCDLPLVNGPYGGSARLTNNGKLALLITSMTNGTGTALYEEHLISPKNCSSELEASLAKRGDPYTRTGANLGSTIHVNLETYLVDRIGVLQRLHRLGANDASSDLVLNRPVPAITAVAIRPDRKLLATGGEDGSIAFWDAETGDSLAFVEGYSGPVASLLFSPDGRLLASSASQGRDVIVWDVSDDFQLLPVVPDPAELPRDTAITPSTTILGVPRLITAVLAWSVSGLQRMTQNMNIDEMFRGRLHSTGLKDTPIISPAPGPVRIKPAESDRVPTSPN